jgi:ferric-dicitrate binding protein FerR (iron transport regulator)
MSEPISEKILVAYFEKRATPHEKLLISEWLKDKRNEEIFYEFLAKWELNHLQYVPDEDRAIKKFKAFMDGGKEERQTRLFVASPIRRGGSLFNYKMAGIAASVIFIICFGFYLFRDQFLYDFHTTSYGMTRNVLLPDGSEITLNANSTLKVPKELATAMVREVWLDGEAFFSIAKRPGKIRFVVHTTNLDVEVLGTKFNVNNRRGKTEVVLSEGKVKLVLRDDTSDPVIMKPGEYVSLSGQDMAFQKKDVEPENFTAWQSNKLVFEDTPLKIVAEKIQDYYGVEVVITNQNVALKLLTGTLPNNDIGVVLRSLETSHNLKIQRDGNRITIE